MTILRTTFLLALAVGACTADVPGYTFDDVPAEPALTTSEVSALPDGTEVEHGADLQADLAAEQPTDDASAYNADDVDAMIDVEVTDTAPTEVIAHAALLHWGLHPR